MNESFSTAARAVTLHNIDLTDGFWQKRQALIRRVTMGNVYKRFAETGRFEAFRFNWKEGMPNKPHIFWDSDVAKWIEAVAYLTEKQRDPELEAIVDDVVEQIEKNRMPDGYFNSYFGLLEPENRFTKRWAHELYCAGHLLEAAIAYKEATGKDRFYQLMKDYMDLIYRIFYVEHSAAFSSPGHEEIELALVKLYRHCGEKKYLDLAQYFVEDRGKEHENPDDPGHTNGSYHQDHLPIREQKTAEGHAVRACYFYCAVADLARETNDKTLFDAADTLFENIVRRRMYVTGGIGQTPVGEAFMEDFDLPNQSAYAETCANLSLALFARRMSVLCPDAKYADTAELVLYNSFLSGISLDGRAFFYANMHENDSHVRRRHYDGRHRIYSPEDERVEVFGCSCCPPNVVRTIASIADFQYTTDGNTVWCHQYISSHAKIDGRTLQVETGYPYDGAVRLIWCGTAGTLALRIPGWCKSYTLTKNGAAAEARVERGYAYLEAADGDVFMLTMEMQVRYLESDPRVWEDAGRVAVARGPLVYCMEGCDNDFGVALRDLRLPAPERFVTEWDETLGAMALTANGYRRDWSGRALYDAPASLVECPLRLIPYFSFANRGATDLLLWFLRV